jgi:hypothetical protein
VKRECYLYKTESGWHWEVVGRNWVLSDHLGTGIVEGYLSREAGLKAARTVCKALGIEFFPDTPF